MTLPHLGAGREGKPHIGGQVYEIGQVINFSYYPDHDAPAMFEGKVRVISWNPIKEEIGFEAVEGTFSATLNASDSVGVTAAPWTIYA